MNGKGTLSFQGAFLKTLACCCCNKLFIRRNNQEKRSKGPYLLNCGHSVCESCCHNVTTTVISCGVCGSLTQLSFNNATSILPRNAYLEGRIYLEKNLLHMDNISYKIAMKQNRKVFHNNFGINYLDRSLGTCYECSKTIATKACQQCDCNFCDPCWIQVHSSGKSLQKHVPMKRKVFKWNNVELCNVHDGKTMEFYCRECKVYACPNCIVLSHQGENHKPVTLQERNSELFEDVHKVKEEVNLNMKRMIDTMAEVKAYREKVRCRDASYEDLQRRVVQNFVHLHGVLQVAEESVLKRLESAETAKRDRLDEILSQLDRQIETVRVVVERVDGLQKTDEIEKDVLFERILDTLTTLKNLPSRLVKTDSSGKEDTSDAKPAISFDESVIERLKNYCSFNIPTGDVLELKGDGTDDVIFRFAEQERQEDVYELHDSAKEEDAVSVKSKYSDCSDDLKKITFKTYSIKSSNKSLSVLPMSKTKPLSMMEGNAYPVCVTYVKDPGEFYVMRSSLRKQRQKIDVLALTLAARVQEPPKDIQKDEYYLVQYAVDKKWYRGRVVDVLPRKSEDEETVAVIYYLDYGNKQEVPLNRMRDMPTALREEPPLAVKCKLFSCVPRSGSWCKGSTKVMLDVLDKSVVTMYVMKVLPDCLEVDLCRRGTDESPDHELISLRDMMVFLGYASFAERNDDMKNKRGNLKYPAPVVPDAEDTFRGFITYVESESLFYVQKIGPDTQYLLNLMDRLNDAYTKSSMKCLIYDPDIDMPCAALYPQDGKWYRGEIIDFPEKETLTIHYVDYGNKEVVHWKSVRRLQPEFLKLVPQALPCSLMDVPRTVNSRWRRDVKDRLERYASEILRVFVVGKKAGKLKVMLYTMKNHCLNDEMMEEVAGKVTAEGSGKVKVDNDSPGTTELKKHWKRQKVRNDEVNQVEDTPEESTDEVFRMEVKVLQASSPSNIYVSLLCFAPRAEELEKELQEFYATSEPDSEPEWKTGDRCAALSCKLDKWYRATVEEVLEDGRLRVLFKDVMETEHVPVSNVRKLDERFFVYPVGAIKCHLSGIFPPESDWPGLTCDFLQSQLDSYKHVYMTKMGDIDNNSLPIQLWVKKRNQGGALEPTMEEWVVLNDLIVEQGLAVPEKAKLVRHIISKEDLQQVDSVDWRQPKFVDDIPSDALVETEDSFIPSVACDWPPPEPCRKDRFMGVATYVDSDGGIYMHDEKDKPILDKIRTSLLDYYEESRPQAHDQYWSEGQLCIVKYYLDGGWYRGKVVKVNEDCTYDILFVDYGNKETCRTTDMRKDIKHLEVPTLTRRYVLHGVRLITVAGKYPSQVIDYIHSSVVEKCCNVTVVEMSEDESKPCKVRIMVCPEGFDLGEDLVNLGLAEFERKEAAKETSVEAVPQVPIARSYSELVLPKGFTVFPIEVVIVKYPEFFVHISDHETIPADIRKVISDFVTLTEEIQSVAEEQENVKDFSEGVPCISLYSDNGTWYRAEVLRCDTDQNLVLVRYVDYGNEEYVTKSRIRKCSTKWFNVPRMALKLKLYNVRMCSGVKKTGYLEMLTKCLSQPGLSAEVVQANESFYLVRVMQNGVLAYQEMIDNGLMEFARPENIVTQDLIDFYEKV